MTRMEEALDTPGPADDGVLNDMAPASAAGLMVRRARLLRDLATQGRRAGLSVVCAPDGWGKTALLLQYADECARDRTRGAVRLFDAGSWDMLELTRSLDDAFCELSRCEGSPVILVDNVPPLQEEGVSALRERLRAGRERGIEFVLACRPEHRALLRAMSDAHRIGASALAVRPREYPEWARMFSIAPTVDVYELTQGIPALVVLLQGLDGRDGEAALRRGVVALYRSVLEALHRGRERLERLASLLILLKEGSAADLSRCGMRVRAESWERLARDYPMFGVDVTDRTFRCLGQGPEFDGLRRDVAVQVSGLAFQAVDILMAAGQIDRAVRLASLALSPHESLQVIAAHPAACAVSGNAVFVHETVSVVRGGDVATVPVGVVLAVYMCALVMGEYRTARAMRSELRRRADDIEREVDPRDWEVAQGFSEVWSTCAHIDLPVLSAEFLQRVGTSPDAGKLREHRSAYDELLSAERSRAVAPSATSRDLRMDEGLNIPDILLECDRVMDEALHGDAGDIAVCDKRLQRIVSELLKRRLVAVASRVRMAAAVCRVMVGQGLVDERAFVDAGTIAVRESDFATQLFCLAGEGWQAMVDGQLANAQFRARQVLRLADGSLRLLHAWAHLLDQAVEIMNMPRSMLIERAGTIDLSQGGGSLAEMWSVAMVLSAARCPSELSAWFSLHKAQMLDERFCPLARQALLSIGERADAVRRLLPSRVSSRYLLGSESERSLSLFEVVGEEDASELGRVQIGLFGGFRAERNGHVLTQDVWKRKKAAVLAARLVLAAGSFVGRHVITEEMWPDLPYERARENLYVAVSTLRRAFGQRDGGPQYVIAQGDGLAVNVDYVISDTMRFEMLARDALLKRTGTSGRQIVEACLRLDEVYAGALFVPRSGSPDYFARMRRAYANRFVDCMLRGVAAALEMDDIASASWLVETALKQAPLREDAIRCAMRIYDMSGRRREVVELYRGHREHLSAMCKAAPEEETRLLYEGIMEKTRLSVVG